MKQTLQFSATITNPAGIEWVIGSGADVGADLYMVAPVGSASVPSPSALYELDPTTGEATILGALGVVDPTDIAWDKDGSMMYLIDKDSDALYTVRQIQAPSPPPPLPMPEIGTEQVGVATQFGLTDVTVSAPRGLAFVGSTLYMVDDNTDALYTVDTTTGVASRVGSATKFGIVDANGQAVADVSPRGLAWDGTNLYMMTNDMLYTLSTTTGIATLVGRLIVGGTQAGPSDPFGLAYAYGGEFLYMVNRGDSPALYRMSKLGNVYRVASAAIDRFRADVSNPTGLVWNGNTLYTSNITSDGSGVLYTVDKGTGIATRVEALGIDNPTDLAWDNASSTLYVVDDDTDSLYKVTDLLRSYLPNTGDLYYNGDDFADAFMRWDYPRWKRDDTPGSQCEDHVTKCSTYEHDLILDWSDDGGWFTVKRASRSIPGFGSTVWPGYLNEKGEIEAYGDLIDSAHFCTSWTDLPQGYNDCETSGVAAEVGEVELSFGTFKAPEIVAGRDYYGFWTFNNQRRDTTPTDVRLYGAEGEYARGNWRNLYCLPHVRGGLDSWIGNNWCVASIADRKVDLFSDTTATDSDSDDVATRWTYGTPDYVKYTRE